MLHVTCHMSCVTCHMSHVKCNFSSFVSFFGQTDEAYRWRVCYQRGLFLGILKAACLSVDWVPKLIQKIFSTMEQKLFQRCETEIVADACNAS